jgi:hypothetical protein
LGVFLVSGDIIKNYGLSGVNRILQLGKRGPKLVADSANGTLSATTVDGSTLTTMSGANAISAADFVTKAQLDIAQGEEGTLSVNFSHTDTNILMGVIPAGNKTVITTVTISTAFNDSNANITVGSLVSAGALSGSQYNDPTVTQNYQTVTTVDLAADTEIYVNVSAGNASIGNGVVTVSFT